MKKETPIYEGEINPKKNPWRKYDAVLPPGDMIVLGLFKRQNKQDMVKTLERKFWRSKETNICKSEHHEPLASPVKWKFTF